jgi:hypothetical protein
MEPVRVLYLGGLGRSGTTLLERVVGELPGAVPLGEVVHLWRRDLCDGERCGCGEPFLACPFWTAVGERAFGGWRHVDVDRVVTLALTVDRTRFVPGLALKRWTDRHWGELREYTDYYVRLYRAVQAETGATVVIDSSKHASLAYCLSHNAEIDLRVLHVVRDSRGVAYSWTKHVDRPETDGADEMTRFSPGHTALLWNAHNAAFSVLEPRNDRVQVMRLQYEHFVADPVDITRAVARFAGLKLGPGDLDFLSPGSVTLSPCHSAAGNPMRFRTGELAIRHDDAWRQALPDAQRRLVSALTAPFLVAYGYSLDAD